MDNWISLPRLTPLVDIFTTIGGSLTSSVYYRYPSNKAMTQSAPRRSIADAWAAKHQTLEQPATKSPSDTNAQPDTVRQNVSIFCPPVAV